MIPRRAKGRYLARHRGVGASLTRVLVLDLNGHDPALTALHVAIQDVDWQATVAQAGRVHPLLAAIRQIPRFRANSSSFSDFNQRFLAASADGTLKS
jgi:hypothetical protein